MPVVFDCHKQSPQKKRTETGSASPGNEIGAATRVLCSHHGRRHPLVGEIRTCDLPTDTAYFYFSPGTQLQLAICPVITCCVISRRYRSPTPPLYNLETFAQTGYRPEFIWKEGWSCKEGGPSVRLDYPSRFSSEMDGTPPPFSPINLRSVVAASGCCSSSFPF